ncbi:MAG: glycosyltransferase family 2 protein [Magnetococcales bacterium]|nr:glycosyltransferase family 2 protein [Magnetococcales bacterium]
MISAIVVTYHTGPVLYESLAALLASTSLHELIIVDNGNPSATRHWLKQWSRELCCVRLLQSKRNMGFAAAVNWAASLAEGDYLALVNPDLLVEKESLHTLVNELKRHPQAWLAGARLQNRDGSEQRGGRRDFLTPWRAIVEYGRLWKIFPNHPYFRSFNLHRTTTETGCLAVPTISGALMVIPRFLWQRLQGFDAHFFLHVEDIDLCLRIHKMGGETLYCGSVPVIHWGGTSRASLSFIEFHKTKGLSYYFRKHFLGVYPKWGIQLIVMLLWARWLLFVPQWFWKNRH